MACSKSTLAAKRSRVGHCDKSEYGLFLFAGSQTKRDRLQGLARELQAAGYVVDWNKVMRCQAHPALRL
jgi:hypothetical protein